MTHFFFLKIKYKVFGKIKLGEQNIKNLHIPTLILFSALFDVAVKITIKF
jgi:hypothetical protein